MPYTNFTLKIIEEKFGVTNRYIPLFDSVLPIKPSRWLLETLEMGKNIPLRSEKAKSEAILMPILMEMKKQTKDYFNIHSGEVLTANAKMGLNGECDFLLSKNKGTYSINLPILSVVEAKKGDIDLGIDQCAAQMIGANMVNNKTATTKLDVLYGCSTNGYQWKFLKLENDVISIDTDSYNSDNLSQVLGVFTQIFNYYKATIG
jgi:hypothetical protein